MPQHLEGREIPVRNYPFLAAPLFNIKKKNTAWWLTSAIPALRRVKRMVVGSRLAWAG